MRNRQIKSGLRVVLQNSRPLSGASDQSSAA